MPSADRLIELFHEAKARATGPERHAFLAESCGDDAELKAQVLSLLGAHDDAGEFLKAQPALSPEIEAELARLKPEEVGERIGPYKLREQIGEGGFGVVWVAEQQEPVRRTVALKIIKMGMDTKEVVARFEQERQALAMMDHPNIARVFDAGATEHGRPFFVMELVRGIKITDYCDQANLPTAQRLALFITVCHAVQHAHQKGIIHRDLKPSNILVTLHDGVPVPKVIDFGVAKATQGPLSEHTVYTQFQQMIGTPLYMSPEQAEMSGLDVDTRTDIYALGVLLYELLTGRTPFDADTFKKAGYDEMRRLIREQEPPKPSTALDTMAQATLTTVAHHRSSEPPKLIHAIRGDLDWIVMKTLEKDRARRYDTANGLAADIQRHLENEPVVARPPSTGYRFQKLVRRNKLAFAAASAVAAALIVGLGLSTWLFFRERAALKVADDNARRAAHQAERAERSRQQAETNAREAQAARVAETEQRSEAERQRGKAEENLKKARQTVDEYFTTISQTTLLEAPGLQPLRKQLLEAALAYYQGFLEQARDNPELRADLAASYLRLSVIYVSLDRNDDGVTTMLQGLELVDEVLQKQPADAELPRRLAGFFKISSNIYGKTRPPSDPAKAAETLQKAARIWERFVRDYPATLEFQGDLAGVYVLLSALFQVGGDKDRELAYAVQARTIMEKVVLAEPDVAAYHQLLLLSFGANSYALITQGRPLEAEGRRRDGVGYFAGLALEFPTEPNARHSLARVHLPLADSLQKTQPTEAESLYRRAIELMENLVAASPSNATYRRELYISYHQLTKLLRAAGREEEAEALAEKALPINEQLVLEFPDMPDFRLDLAGRYLALAERLKKSRPQEAEQTLRKALAMHEKIVAEFPNHGRFVTEQRKSLRQLILLLQTAGKTEELEKLYRSIITQLEGWEGNAANVPDYWNDRARRHNRLGLLLKDTGRNAEAEIELNKAQELWKQHPDPALEKAKRAVEAEPQKTGLRHDLGFRLFNSGQWQASLDEFEKVIQVGASAWQWFFMAMDHWQLGNHEDARQWFYKSIDWMESAQEPKLLDRQAEAAVLLGLPDPGERSAKAAAQLKRGDALQQQGQKEKAAEAYGQAIRLYESLAEDFPAVPGYRTKQVDLLTKVGRLTEIESVIRDTLATQQRLLGNEHPEVTATLHRFGRLLREQGKLSEAEPYFREAITAYEQLAQKNPDSIDYRVRWGHSRWQLGGVLSDAGRRGESEQVYLEALRGFEQAARDFPTNTFFRQEQAFTYRLLAGVVSSEGRADDAERHYRAAIDLYAALAAELPQIFYFHEVDETTKALKRMLEGAGRTEAASSVDYLKAIALSEKANAERRKSLGSEHPEVAASLCGLSFLYRQQGDLPAAESTAREALAIRRKLLNNEHADVAQALHLLAWNLHLRGNRAEAETLSREELAMWRKLMGAEDLKVAWNLVDLTAFLREQGKLVEAEAAIRESLTIRRKKLGKDHLEVAYVFKLLSELLQKQGKPAETLN